MGNADSTQLLISLVNQVKDELKSDIAEVKADICLLKSAKKPLLSFDWKHYFIGCALIASLSFNFGSESNKQAVAKTLDSVTAVHTAKAAASSTYVDLAKVYKLTNGNAAGN
jgi:hypothetical protein